MNEKHSNRFLLDPLPNLRHQNPDKDICGYCTDKFSLLCPKREKKTYIDVVKLKIAVSK